MATKISGLSSATNIGASDLIQVVDVNDTTMAVTGTNKKATAQIVGNNLPVVATGSTTSRKLKDRFADVVNVKDFGAVGDGVTDDTVAIQAAINAVPNNGGAVYLPSGRYRVTQTINVGNGTDSLLSTKNCISINGDGIGSYFGTSAGTEIFYDGVANEQLSVISFNGSGDGFRLDGIEINANSLAGTGLRIFSVRTSTFSNFACLNFTKAGLDLKIRSGPNNAVKFASGNLFLNFFISSNNATQALNGSFGILMQGNYANNDDWHRNTFIGGVCQIAKSLSNSSPNACALYLGFTDSNTFTECDFKVFNNTPTAGTGYALYLNAVGNNNYPENNFFYGCALMADGTNSVAWNESTENTFGDHVFYNYTTKDLETVPDHPKLRLITDSGNSKSMGDYEIRKNTGSVTFRTPTTNTAYRLLGNITDSVDFGLVTQRTSDLSTYSTLTVINSLGHFFAGSDNQQSLGTPTYRWSVVYAGTGAINTSDEREKQQIRSISNVEKAVAVRLKGLIKAFKFNDAVDKKEDGARIHFGAIAQEVVAAFQSEGLDPSKYGLLCYDEWDEQPEVKDSDGNIIQKYRPAGNCYGLRYEELLAFIISAI
jgi:hypothetical protein